MSMMALRHKVDLILRIAQREPDFAQALKDSPRRAMESSGIDLTELESRVFETIILDNASGVEQLQFRDQVEHWKAISGM